MLGSRLRQFRESCGLTLPELAKRCGWKSGSRISNYEQGTRKLRLEDLMVIMHALQIPFACLLSKEEPQQAIAQASQQQAIRKVPLIDWQLAMKGKDAVDTLNTNQPHQQLLVENCSDKSFGLRMKGDAMVSSVSGSKCLAEGEIIIADPMIEPEHGKNVIAALPQATEAICRQYITEGGVPYLNPLNPKWDLIRITPDVKICGVVVAKVNYEV